MAMKLDLTGLLNGTESELTVKESLAADFTDDEVYVEGPIGVDMTFFKAGDLVIGKGRLNATIRQSCSRCLNEVFQPVTVEIFEQFKKENPASAGNGEIELGEEDFVFPLDGDGWLDLKELVRQNLVLNLPEKVLCRKDCPGIKSDITRKKKIDPRLEKLKEAL